MNFSIKKLFCVVACGSLVLTAVPTKAEFSWSSWSIAGLALGVAGACYFLKSYFTAAAPCPSLAISDLQTLKNTQNLKTGDLFSVDHDIQIPSTNDSQISLRNVHGIQVLLPAGTYKVNGFSRYTFRDSVEEDDGTVTTTVTSKREIPCINTKNNKFYVITVPNEDLGTLDLDATRMGQRQLIHQTLM